MIGIGCGLTQVAVSQGTGVGAYALTLNGQPITLNSQTITLTPAT